MPANPELGPTVSRYNQQRMAAAHEANRPETGPVGQILTAIVAEDHYDQTESHHQESDRVWRDTRERLINADPTARAAKKRCRQISARIQELENSPGIKWTSQIAGLRAELGEAERPYTKASSRVSTDPELQWAAANREQNRRTMEEAGRNLDQARRQALNEINQQLPIDLTWGELEDLLGSRIKQELKTAEIRLLAATIDRQETAVTANRILKTRLGKISSGQAAAARIRNLKNGQV